ncbi:hypothetical protein [Streptomyces canus]|uniref:hypothetical protein n=1 Tax=Streptomyces canus TaxID=58343 RepID=UPI000360813F|nr:hypothetical protein [Streptomyces canus]
MVIAEAASLVAPGQMPALYEKAAKGEGQHLAFKVTNRLPKQGPLGVVPGIAVFALLVAGYLGSTLAVQRTGTASARRRVLSLIGYAVIAGLVFDVIIGPILGAHPDVDTNFWPLWGEFTLMCLAVALLAATLQSLIGPIGTLLTVVIVVLFGNPSTGGVNGTAYLPAFWQYLGPVLTPWNGAPLVRNTLYFDGNAITQQFVVLSIYVVVGAALVTISTYGPAVVARHQTTPTHQPRRRGRHRRHPTRMNRPRPASRRPDRAGQAPGHTTPAGCSDGSDRRRLPRLSLPLEYGGSARGTA